MEYLIPKTSEELVMWLLGLLISVCGLVQGLSRIDPLVATKAGLIRGLSSENGYAKFLGVPYALVNESNPFGPAAPHPGFDNIFEAYEPNACPQVHGDLTVGTFDCLSVNIYVPNTANSANRLPVMVWIHGGAFVEGSAYNDGAEPSPLLRHDVIVVGINYRLGAYGFMCLDIPEVPGNQGLKDQVLALRWINENIESFGGNSRQITVFGESAGGMSVNLHLYSSYEKLFQRAIIQSGPAMTPLLSMASDNSYPIKLARALNFDTSDVSDALEYLSSVDPHHVAKAAKELYLDFIPLTLPCIEKEFEGVEHFLTEHPRYLISIKAKTIPVIIGHNNKDYFETFNFEDSLATGFEFGDDLNCAVDDVRHFYIGDEKVAENFKLEMTEFATDFQFGHPTQVSAEKLLNDDDNAVYRYVFSYSGGRNLMAVYWNITATGAAHGDELGYLFDMPVFIGETTPEDQLMVDRMTTLWTNFAKYGDPTLETSDLLPVRWEPITRTTQPYLSIDSDVSLQARPFHDRMAFWDLFYKLYGKYQK